MTFAELGIYLALVGFGVLCGALVTFVAGRLLGRRGRSRLRRLLLDDEQDEDAPRQKKPRHDEE